MHATGAFLCCAVLRSFLHLDQAYTISRHQCCSDEYAQCMSIWRVHTTDCVCCHYVKTRFP